MNRAPTTPSGHSSLSGHSKASSHPTPPGTHPRDDLEARLSGYRTGTVHPPVLPEQEVSYWVDDTAVGRMLFAVRRGGAVLATRFAPDAATEEVLLARLAAGASPLVLRLAWPTDAVRRQVGEFLSGRRRRFDVEVDLALAAPFQRRVLLALREGVPFGSRSTYGALATAVGSPRAARAVGAALGANPLCVVVPCHRVVAADGALSGYAGGPAAKRLLLGLEADRPHHDG